jgi:hypothetical protein
VTRSADGADKIIIKRDDDGHYVYFSVHREDDSGSIIDFIQQRRRLNFGRREKRIAGLVRDIGPFPARLPCPS